MTIRPNYDELRQVAAAAQTVAEAETALRKQCARAMRNGCTGDQVAQTLGISRATLYRMISDNIEQHADACGSPHHLT
jgi:predicted DNA-binding protein (UPF0251 family)